MDLFSLLMEYESNGLTPEQEIELFERLIASGWINSLQGSYQRHARRLYEANLLPNYPCDRVSQ